MTTTKKTNNKCWRDCEGNLCTLLMVCKLVRSQWKHYEALQKSKQRTAMRHSSSTCGCSSKEDKGTTPIRYVHPCVHSSIICNSQEMGTIYQPLTDERMKKLWYVYIQTHTHTPAKKKKNKQTVHYS